MVIRGYDVAALAKKTWAEIGKDKASVYAAQMAYAFFFALFPLLLFFAALLSLVADKQTVMADFNGRIAEALPGDVASLLGKTIEKVIFAKGAPGLLSFGLVTAAWSGSSIFAALRAALNVAYDVEETRPWWKQYVLQLGMLVVAGVIIVASTVILVNGEGVVAWLGARLGLTSITTLTWTVAQYPLAFGAVVAVLWMIYYFLPNCRHQDKKILIIGATLSTLLWIAATLLFRVYVQKFNALNPAYGAIGAIMVLLTWMYYSSFVLLAVGELTAELQAGSGRVDKPRSEAPTRRAVRRTRHVVTSAWGWVEAAAAHIRADIALARREIAAALRSADACSLLCAAGATIGLLGALSLITGLVLVIGDQWLPRDSYALAAFIVAVIAGAMAWMFARRGLSTLTRR
jgi:membrane protein